MHQLTITPAPLAGQVTIPPSKSVAHRAIMAASLAAGISHVQNIDLSDDMIATIDGMRALHATIDITGDSLLIKGIGSKRPSAPVAVDCNESGSTLRFLVPVALALGGEFTFTGRGNLGKRPLTPYYKLLDRQAIPYSTGRETFPLSVDGRLSPDVISLPGDISSQFITGLLFALPLLECDSEIKVTSPLQSKGYVDLTLQVLREFGIQITHEQYQHFYIKGKQGYAARAYTVEGDYSQAAFFLCAAALGSDVTVAGLKTDSLQGDKEILPILERMGATITDTPQGLRLTVGQLRGTIIDASEIPDIIPVLAATACVAKGQTVITNAGRLRIKECDRFAAIINEMTRLGADIASDGDSILIQGKERLRGGCAVQSYADHRIAMSLAIIAQACEQPVTIHEYTCVAKSYPRFFEDFAALGGSFQ